MAPLCDGPQLTRLALPTPARPLLAYVKSIQGTRELAQVAWNFTNDSLKSAVVVLGFAPRAIAAAAVSLAAQYVQQGESALPRCGPNKELPWYTAFKVEHASVESIKEQIIEMYGGSLPPKVSNSTLGNSVAEGLVGRRHSWHGESDSRSPQFFHPPRCPRSRCTSRLRLRRLAPLPPEVPPP